MKKLIKIIALCLALITLVSMTLTGCSQKAGVDLDKPLEVDNSKNHSFSATKTNDYFIQNGVSKYKIVISDNPSTMVREAASELFSFTSEASGAVLETISATQALDNGTIKAGENDRFISLGINALSDMAELSDTSGLGSDGFKIITKDKNIYVIGEDYGTLNGVYELLNIYFDYEFFYKDTYSLTQKESVNFYELNVKEIPDFAHRAGGYGTMWQEDQTIRRYRMRVYSHQFIPIKGQIFHNAFAYLPITEHLEAHSEWYNTTGDQVCYTAHGDQEQYSAMVAETVKQLKIALSDTQYIDREMVTFSILDNINSCACSACNESFIKYGAESAAIILFLNDVNREIREWFADETETGGKAYARDLKICFFAYSKYVAAPVSQNENGEYVANNGIKTDDGVCALIAPLEADYTVDFDAFENESTKKAMLGWKAVSKDIATWFYDTLYGYTGNNLCFYNTFNGYQNRYKYAFNAGSIWMFNEGQDQIYGGQGGFNSLKMYISSRLAWNVNENYQSIIDRFFTNFYGEASDTMFTLFNEMKARAMYCKDYLNAGGDCYADWPKVEFWPKETLIRWLGLLEQAIEDLQPLKSTDKEKYELYYSHVIFERMQINYMLCSMYEGSLTGTQYNQFRTDFVADADLTQNTRALEVVASWNLA